MAGAPHWTEEDDAKLSALWRSSLEFQEIVRRMARSSGSCAGRASRLRLPARNGMSQARRDRRARERKEEAEILRAARASHTALYVTKFGREPLSDWKPEPEARAEPYRPGIDPKPEWLLQIGKQQRRAA